VRRWFIAGVLTALAMAVAAGCSDDASDQPAASGDAAATTSSAPPDPDRYVVWVDNNAPDGFPATYGYFFPDRLTVHPGATIDFRMDWNSGEPHNVAVGTTIDGAREAIDALPDTDQTLPPGAPLPVSPALQAQFQRMPQALPPDQATTEETMRRAQPCFVVDGAPPLDQPCGPDQRSSTDPFDGTQSYISSQVMFDEGDHFELTLADDMAPGEHTYICTLHPTFMYGTLDVVAETDPVDTPQVVAARGQEAIDELNTTFRPLAEDLAAQTGTRVDAGGLGGDGNRPEITINVFPRRIEAVTGDTITWNVVGAHMFSFDPPADRAVDAVLEERDGVVRPLDWAPDTPSPGRSGMPPFSDIGAAMATGTPIVVDDGSLASGEYLHSGLLFGSLGPLPPTHYRLRVDDPGEYTYYCTRHPGMSGTLEVSP